MPRKLSLEDLVNSVPNVNPEVLRELYRNGWRVEFHDTNDLSHVYDDGSNIPGRTDHDTKTIHVATRAGGTSGILSHEIVHGAQAAIPAKNLKQALANAVSKAQAEPRLDRQVGAFVASGGKPAEAVEKFPYMVAGGKDEGRFADTAPKEFTKMFPNLLQTKVQAEAADADRSMLQSAQRMQAGILRARMPTTSSPRQRGRSQGRGRRTSKPPAVRERTSGRGGVSQF